jgi:hypothetical protein
VEPGAHPTRQPGDQHGPHHHHAINKREEDQHPNKSGEPVTDANDQG